MMHKIQYPGDLVVGDKATFGGAYPLNEHGTGLNNSEWNAYPAAVNDRIFPVAHPLDPKRPTCVQYEVHPGDGQPHYGGAANQQRAEMWYEPHDGVEGSTDGFCSSWVIPEGYGEMPNTWMFLCQNHPGAGYTDWHWPSLNLANGLIKFETLQAFKEFDVVQTGRELFLAVEELLASANGFCRAWISWDKPPDVTKTPFVEQHGATLMGTPMWWKTGIYRGTSNFTNKVVQTTLARRETLAEAVVAAGWPALSGGTPPPPPPPPPPPGLVTIEQTIKQGDTLTGTVTWIATTSDDSRVDHVDFLVDGKLRNTEQSTPYGSGDPPNTDAGQVDTKKFADGTTVFTAVAHLKDGTQSVVAATAKVVNGVVPPVEPTNAQLRDKAVAALKATTISYPAWQKNVAAGKYPAVGGPSQWGIAFEALGKIK